MARALRRIAVEEAFATQEQMRAMFSIARTTWDNLDLGLWRGWARLNGGGQDRLRDARPR